MRFVLSLLLTVLAAVPVKAQTGIISGTVTDAESGMPLPGANVIVVGTVTGTATDVDGRYTLSGLTPGRMELLFTFSGYRNAELFVTVTVGLTLEADVALQPGVELDPVQVTAGRQQEKVLEAPASVSVVGADQIELEAPQSTVRALKNVAGLDIVQTGIDRHEVVLRGFNNAFSGAAHVLTDYRQSSAAVIGVNMHSIMPGLPLDVERVEVVRGPGAALYGPGVDSGVIHYVTKDAFSHPGLTVVAGGGQHSLLNFQSRVAGVIGKKLGLKFSSIYGSANDFELETCSDDLIRAQRFSECPDAQDAQQLFIDGPRDNRFEKVGLLGSAEYRFDERTSLALDAGYGSVQSTVLSGIGTIQAVAYRSTFAQVRLNRGPLFAQAYMNKNDSGRSYVYNGDPVVELSTQANVQAQYQLTFGGDRQELITGIDFEFLNPNSGGTVYGRHEANDAVQELGAYAQSKTRLGAKLDLVVALRGDYHSLFEKVQLSPRAGLVFKPTVANSWRLTYNRTVVNPSATSLFLDLVAAKLPLGGDMFMSVRGRGGVHGYTWARNPAYMQLGATTDLVASSLLPGMEGADMPVGLSTGLVYGFMYEGLAAMDNEELAQLLIDALGLDPALTAVLTAQMDAIKGLLHPDETRVDGFSAGQLGLLNLTSHTLDPIETDLAPLPRIRPQRSMTLEAGYKGIINDKVLVAVDAYYTEKKNFVGSLQMKTPFVLVPSLGADLERDLAAGIAANDGLLTLFEILGTISGLDLTPEAAAAMLVELAGSDLPDGNTPIGVVQPNENHAGIGNLPELLLAYPNFGHISYYGADLAIHVLASEELSLFGNLSLVSDDFFDASETGEEEQNAVLALNAPALKMKLGGTYRLTSGLSLAASGRYVDGFRMVSGQYIGDVERYFLVDLGIGYSISRGLRTDLNISNVTDNQHREFIGAPKIGRVGTVRLLYQADW